MLGVSSMETVKRCFHEGANPRSSKRSRKERKHALLSGWGEDEEQWKTTWLGTKTTWNPGGEESHQVDNVDEVVDQEEPRTKSPPKENKDPGQVPEDAGERLVLSNTPKEKDIRMKSEMNSGCQDGDYMKGTG